MTVDELRRAASASPQERGDSGSSAYPRCVPRMNLSDHAAAVLADGPLPLEQLVDLVLSRTSTRARDPRQAVRRALNRDCLEHDGLWWHIPVLVSGRCLTRRITQEELDEGVLHTGNDLYALALPSRVLMPSNRGELEISHLDDVNLAPLSGPPGWLADVSAGDVLAVRRQGLTLQIDRVTTLADEPELDAQLQQEVVRVLAEQEADETAQWASVGVPSLLHPRLAADPDAFAQAGLPLSERLGTDFAIYGGLITRSDFDRSAFAFFDDDEDEEFLEADWHDGFDLTPEGVQAVEQLFADADLARPDEPSLRRTAEALSDPKVAAAVTAVVATQETAHGLRDLLADAADLSEGRTRAACLTVLATAEEEYVQDLRAEECLLEALEADPTYPPALLAAARYAEDRGEAARAVDLLRRAGVASDDYQLKRLRHFAEPPPSTISRNAPCPCGSGRKHKACCLPKAAHSLAARAPWLREKLAVWALEPAQRDLWVDIVLTIDDGGRGTAAFFDPFVQDLGIWGTDVLEGFRYSREDLLPEDEVALLDTWSDVRPRLYETLAVGSRTVSLRDVIDDTLVEAVHPKLASELRRGELVLLRVLPDGEGGWITGGILPVPRLWRSRLVPFLDTEPDGLDLAEWIAEAMAPPTMLNKHGYDLVLCAGTWCPTDLAATRAALEEEVDGFEGESGSICDEDGSLLVEVLLQNGLISASTMARELWPMAEELVARVAPNATVVNRREVPADQLIDYLPNLQPPAEAPPEVREAIIEHMQNHERRWVDEPVPALGGSTPREALADEAKRKELMELLADMDSHLASSDDPETAMNADRVRALLGLV
jgi:hypothetical protein